MIDPQTWLRTSLEEIENAISMEALKQLRVHLLGKKSTFKHVQKNLMQLEPFERTQLATALQAAEQKVQIAFRERQQALLEAQIQAQIEIEKIDLSLPTYPDRLPGLPHPISQTITEIEEIFSALGFESLAGPEIEDEYHNFDALNMPAYHPARTTQDTFWLGPHLLLRSQTSNVQIRHMSQHQPPYRIISPGRVYRSDYDATHTPMFHQIEGLMVDQSTCFTDLMGLLTAFLNRFFNRTLKIRFRPSYFPFTEPSAEVDIQTTDGTFLEVLGCGMVHPEVLKQVGVDPELYHGFAFGLGIERLAMLKHQQTDLRPFFENDIKFLKTFQ